MEGDTVVLLSAAAIVSSSKAGFWAQTHSSAAHSFALHCLVSVAPPSLWLSAM